MFEKLIECSQIRELIKPGWLVPTKVYAPSTPDLTGLRLERGDYVESHSPSAWTKPSWWATSSTHVLRGHPRLAYLDDGHFIGHFPAMLAPVVGADGDLRSVHRTYFGSVPGKRKKLLSAVGTELVKSPRRGSPSARLRQVHADRAARVPGPARVRL